MKDVSPSDLAEVRRESLFSASDIDCLVDLYAPLVGMKAIGVFLLLLHQEEGVDFGHESLLKKGQISCGEFSASVSALEAVGLVVTYYQAGEKFNDFIYCLYAPKSPKEFFDNDLLIGTLRRYLDNDKIDALAKKYALTPLPGAPFQNVSTSFPDFFQPDFDAPEYAAKKEAALAGREQAPILLGFDKNAFLSALIELDPRFSAASFLQSDWVRIARLATLYSYDAAAMASFVSAHYDFRAALGQRIDWRQVKKDAEENLRFSYLRSAPVRPSEAHGDSEVARVIRGMEKMSPVQFLSSLQKGNKPARSDLALLEELTVEMGLSNPVCNACVFYVLSQHNNVLIAPFAEKVAGSLMREKVETALDAWNYLTASKRSLGSRKAPETKENPLPPKEETPLSPTPAATPAVPDGASMSDADFDKMMASLYDDGGKK